MIVILALKTCSTLLCAVGTAKRKTRTSSSRRWCSLCSASSSHCCCTSVVDGSNGCVGKNSSGGDNWSNARNRMTMDCSASWRSGEGRLGCTTVIVMTRALYQDFRFVYLLEAFNHLLAPHHVFKFISPCCFPQWQADWPLSAAVTPRERNSAISAPPSSRQDSQGSRSLMWCGEISWISNGLL